jgi:hypothetical protein
LGLIIIFYLTSGMLFYRKQTWVEILCQLHDWLENLAGVSFAVFELRERREEREREREGDSEKVT